MVLQQPFQIGSRLLPTLRVGDGWVSLEHVGNAENRMVYRWYIDIPAGEFSEADLKSGMQGAGYQEMFGSLLAFLGAAAESLAWEERTGREGENTNLFPRQVVEWAREHDDELAILKEEIESTPNLVAE